MGSRQGWGAWPVLAPRSYKLWIRSCGGEPSSNRSQDVSQWGAGEKRTRTKCFFLTDCQCLQREQLDGFYKNCTSTLPVHCSRAPGNWNSPAVWECHSGWEARLFPHHCSKKHLPTLLGKAPLLKEGYVCAIPTTQAVLLPKVKQIHEMTSKQNWWKEETNISSLKLGSHNTLVSIRQLTYANIFCSLAKFSTN